MKVKCEICDGNLMMQEKGYVICVDCGIQYSIERIKELYSQTKPIRNIQLSEKKNKIKLIEKYLYKEEIGNYEIRCKDNSILDLKNLKPLIQIVDKYQTKYSNNTIQPNECIKRLFLEKQSIVLNRGLSLVRLNGVSKDDANDILKDVQKVVETPLVLIDMIESDDKDFVISTDNIEHIEIGVIKKYIGNASTVRFPNDIQYIGTYQDGESIFEYPEKIKEIDLEGNFDTIGSHAFKGCSELEHIEIPNNIQYLGYSLNKDDLGNSHLFEGCIKLKSVVFGKNAWNDYDTCNALFKDCVSLESVVLPETISMIPSSTFEGCISLEEIWIPDKVGAIEANAFKGCKSLKRVYLPNHPIAIHPSAFEGTPYQPPREYVMAKKGKKCPVCGGKFTWDNTCKKCGRHIWYNTWK